METPTYAESLAVVIEIKGIPPIIRLQIKKLSGILAYSGISTEDQLLQAGEYYRLVKQGKNEE